MNCLKESWRHQTVRVEDVPLSYLARSTNVHTRTHTYDTLKGSQSGLAAKRIGEAYLEKQNKSPLARDDAAVKSPVRGKEGWAGKWKGKGEDKTTLVLFR